MIAALNRALRQALPPLGMVQYVVIITAGFYVGEWLIMATTTAYFGAWPEEWGQPRAYNMVIPLALFFQGCWRAAVINPALDKEYRDWLRSTPWTAARLLPLGPVHLVWQDALIVGGASALWTLEGDPLYLSLAFLLPYSWFLMKSNYWTDEDGALFAAIALAVGLLLTINQPAWVTLAVAIAMSAACAVGFHRSLRRFPWDESMARRTLDKPRRTLDSWPRVNPAWLMRNEPRLSRLRVTAISVLAAWAAGVVTNLFEYAATVRGKFDIAWNTCLLVGVFSIIAGTGRLLVYAGARGSPLGLWGRLKSGRLIIPGYDRVFIAPLATAAAGCTLPAALVALGAPLPVAAFAGVLAVCLAAFGMGPTLAEWDLTGDYRLGFVPPGKDWIRLG